MVVSAFWHGVHSGYYLSIGSCPLVMVVEDLYAKIVRKKLTEKVSERAWSFLKSATNFSSSGPEGVRLGGLVPPHADVLLPGHGLPATEDRCDPALLELCLVRRSQRPARALRRWPLLCPASDQGVDGARIGYQVCRVIVVYLCVHFPWRNSLSRRFNKAHTTVQLHHNIREKAKTHTLTSVKWTFLACCIIYSRRSSHRLELCTALF